MNSLVLRVEVGHINNKILKNEHVSKWSDKCRFANITIDLTNASQSVKTITVHST